MYLKYSEEKLLNSMFQVRIHSEIKTYDTQVSWINSPPSEVNPP